MAEQEQQSNLPSSTSSGNIDYHDKKETEMSMQSETTTSTTQLLERNVKQIQIKEESTVKKVLKTREIKHFNGIGEQISSKEVSDAVVTNSNQQLSNDIPDNGQEDTRLTYSTNQQENSHSTTNQNRILDSYLNHSTQFDPASISQPQQQNIKITQQSNTNQNNLESVYESRFNDQNSNYQNLMAANSANLTSLISNQNEQSSTAPITQPQLHTVQRSTSRNSNLPTSGYEELDSTLRYNNAHLPPQQSVRIGDPNQVNYMTAKTLQVQPIPSNSSILVQSDNVPQNGVSFINHNANYDLTYGSAVPVAQVPIIANNNSLYGTRANPEPVYAINRNGTLTYVTQPTTIDNITDIRWRDPQLEEVISFLTNPDPNIRSNSIAYLQHLSYADDNIKQKTRLLGGIPILIDLLNRDMLEVQRNVCGALRNLSYGRKNDDNKRAIRDAGGVQSMVRTLINNPDNEIRELATSVLWNLSSCEDVKTSILNEALNSIVSVIIVPYTAWFKANLNSGQQFLPTANETHWSTVFRNATGVIRNISSAGPHARKQLRDCDGLIESLFLIIDASICRSDVENKLVENCVCILRNLSYKCEEVTLSQYHGGNNTTNYTDSATNSMQNSPSSPSSSTNLTTSLVGSVTSRVNNLGCFSFTRRSKSKSKSSLLTTRSANTSSQSDRTDTRSATLLPPHHPSNLHANNQSSTMVRTSTQLDGFNSSSATLPRSGLSNISNGTPNAPKGKELLWQSDVVKPYLLLLFGCSNSETLEAAAGAIQNLAACSWKPAIEIRAAVRKEKGLPILVELLRMDRDRVVCVVATALRNLAIDQKNKELIGKYAIPDLVNKLSDEQSEQDSLSSDDTVAAVLATLHEVISNNAEFVRSLYDSGGLHRLNYIVRNRNKYSPRVQRFAAQVLLDMWKFTELREMYTQGGWKESHFIVKNQPTSKNSSYSLHSNTIDRPIASQQADRSSSMRNLKSITNPVPQNMIQQNSPSNINSSSLMNNTGYLQEPGTTYSAVQMTSLNGKLNNPQALYAQVDRQRKRNDISQQQTMLIN